MSTKYYMIHCQRSTMLCITYIEYDSVTNLKVNMCTDDLTVMQTKPSWFMFVQMSFVAYKFCISAKQGEMTPLIEKLLYPMNCQVGQHYDVNTVLEKLMDSIYSELQVKSKQAAVFNSCIFSIVTT